MMNLTKKLEEERELKDKIIRFMTKVETLQETNPQLAFRYLTQATKLYHEKLGYEKRIDKRFNEVFISFIQEYQPEFSF